MRILISLALMFGFFLLLLVGLLTVLQDLFAAGAHHQPSMPGAEADRSAASCGGLPEESPTAG
jgi:hypothetical protein